jgi:hypothetical protein
MFRSTPFCTLDPTQRPHAAECVLDLISCKEITDQSIIWEIVEHLCSDIRGNTFSGLGLPQGDGPDHPRKPDPETPNPKLLISNSFSPSLLLSSLELSDTQVTKP